MRPDDFAILIPLFGIVFGVGVAIVTIVTQSRRRLKEYEMRHKERMTAIERGLDVPAEPLEPADGKRPGGPLPHPMYLLRGMIWTGVGIAIYFSAGDLISDRLAQLGAIPAAVGVAYLIFYFVAKPKDPAVPGEPR